MFGLMAGCFSAKGTCPFKGSSRAVPFFLLLTLSEPHLEDEEFLQFADDDDEDEDEEEDKADAEITKGRRSLHLFFSF